MFNLKYITKSKFKLISLNKFNFSNDYENFFFKNRQAEDSDKTDKTEKTDQTEKKKFKRGKQTDYFLSQRMKLVDKFEKDLNYFKFEENFELIDLKKKYLTLAKLYHPDTKTNDAFSTIQFNKLQESYERLKIFCELREKISERENNISDDGTIILEKGEYGNFSELFEDQMERREVIHRLCKKSFNFL